MHVSCPLRKKEECQQSLESVFKRSRRIEVSRTNYRETLSSQRVTFTIFSKTVAQHSNDSELYTSVNGLTHTEESSRANFASATWVSEKLEITSFAT